MYYPYLWRREPSLRARRDQPATTVGGVWSELCVRHGHSAQLAQRPSDDHLGLQKTDGRERLDELTSRLDDLQRRLWAEHARSVLLILQGLDTSGKDGTIRRVFTGLNPQGCRVVSFKAPSDLEKDHDYLWRVHHTLPVRGEIGIFNRSHYEDVVTARAIEVIGDDERKRRHRQIRDFERTLTEEGIALVKVFLHLGKDEQRRRLETRLADPAKRWKFRPEDLETRAKWDEYVELYEETITETSTEWAPWYVVPADRKWLSAVVVAGLLVEVLERMNPAPPPSHDFDGVVVD
jgi:PPK2 family polyphosphate:nucleotide phosphotransferase